MSQLHFQLDHSRSTDEYAARGRALSLRLTRELILNPEGLNPDPELERIRTGAAQTQRLYWPLDDSTAQEA